MTLMGGCQVQTATGATVQFPTRKTALVFAYLALRAGRAEQRARLAGLLWSDRGEDQARGSLRQSLFAIRRALDKVGGPGFETTSETARVPSESLDVDALAIERLSGSNSAADLRKLQALYRGPLLDGWDGEDPIFDEWLRAERTRRDRQVLGALRRLVALEWRSGELAAALLTAERVCAIDPVCEETHRAAMQIHLEQGNRNEALRIFEQLRRSLDRELGVEPEPETLALAAKLKRPFGSSAQSAPADAPPIPGPVVVEAHHAPRSYGAQTTAKLERRYVAVLAAALDTTANAAAETDPETQHAQLSQFLGDATQIATEFGGQCERRSGSRIVAVFGAPLAYGNDCERAVRAALALRAQSADNCAVKTAISYGPVYAEPSGPDAGAPIVSGNTVDLAEMLVLEAPAGQTLLSAAARESLGPRAEAKAVQSASQPASSEPTWRLTDFRPDMATAFVGRDAEIAQLEAALDACISNGRGRIIHIRGEPGIGKTRLAEEARRRAAARGFASHRALVLDFGGRTRRDPVRTLIRSLAGLQETDARAEETGNAAEWAIEGQSDDQAALIYNLLDLTPPPDLRSILDAMDYQMRADETGRAAARMIAAHSADHPLFLLVEDLHWIEPGTLESLARIGAVAASHPVVMVLTSRIEGDPLTPAWRAQTGGAPLTTIDVGPMASFEIEALAQALGAHDAETVRRCIDRAGGHPLFLEQLLRLSSDCAAQPNVPPSVQSIVQVRLDQLDVPARLAIQAASVLGQRFAADGLAYLLDGPEPELRTAIAQGLIRAEAGAYLFAHALLQEAIYDTLLPRQRRQFHRRAADWFAERDLTLRAEHLERAEDEHAPAAFRQAAEQHMHAYRYDRAQSLVTSGLELAKSPADRAALLILRGEILHDLGQMQPAGEAYNAALNVAEDTLDRSRALIGRAAVKRVTDDLDGAFADVSEGEKLAERSGASRAALIEQARAQFLRGNLLFPRGETQRCLEAHERSLSLARRAQRADLEAAALGGIGDAQYLAGRMKSACETLTACIEISRRSGYGRIEVANYSQLACAVTHLWPQQEALDTLEAAAASAARVGHKRAEINAHAGQLWALRELAQFERCIEIALESGRKIRELGATRYDQMALLGLGVSLARLGEHKDALARLREGCDVAERTRRGFHGAELYAQLAYLTPDKAESQAALAKVETILAEGFVGHSPLRAYPVAAATALRWDEFARAERYLDALAQFTRPEPLPYTDFYIAYWRAAIAARQRPDAARDAHAEAQLTQTAERLHMRDALARMGNAFGSC